MANIMVNDVCNLQCPYCFANKYVNGDNSTDITYGNFKKAVDWINQSWDADSEVEPPRIGIIGGEPTLHGQFLDLLDYAVMERRLNQEILVFSNALKMDDYIDYFSRNDIGILVNLNSPEDIGRKNYNRVVNNIRQMRLKGIHASIGVNFYKGDLDMEFAYDVIREFGYRELRVGITSPNTKEKAEAGAFTYFREILDPLIEVMERCADLGCDVHFDCQKIPQCILNSRRNQLDELASRINLDIFECAGCTPVIDILPDLKAVRCFGISGNDIAVPISTFRGEQDLIRYFETNIDNVAKLIPGQPACINCYEREIGACQGGCISFKMDKVSEIVKPDKSKQLKMV